MQLRLALGRTVVADAFTELSRYGRRHHATVATYDLGGAGDPLTLTGQEVARTRIIASRISNDQSAWFVERARAAPWGDVPADASLVDADPGERDGLYAAAVALHEHFRTAAPAGVAVAKLHKVLHLKRPGLFPILDSRLLATYATAASRAARQYPRLGARRLFWAAIRDDLADKQNVAALAAARGRLAADGDSQVAAMARLTDLRLLDAVAWRS
ncbi:DUF6308 family protein [Oerskovia turbata]